MSARCDLSDLPVEQCACRIHGPSEVPEVVAVVGQPFEAVYPGMCVRCEGRIVEGDRIARAADASGYVHVEAGRCRS